MLTQATPSDNIKEMEAKKPLPIGMAEFEDWADNIITGSYLKADPDSQKFALAQMLLHLGPTVDHECDGYFIKALRKAAVNQVADAKAKEIQAKVKAKLKEQGEVTAATNAEMKSLGDKT